MTNSHELYPRITTNPAPYGGRPCVRIRVTDVLDLLANGLSPKEIVDEMPDLTLDDMSACIRFAATRLNHAVLVAA